MRRSAKPLSGGNSDREFKSHPLRHLIEFWDYYGILDEDSFLCNNIYHILLRKIPLIKSSF